MFRLSHTVFGELTGTGLAPGCSGECDEQHRRWRHSTWVVAQDARTYLEDAGVLDVLGRRGPPGLEVPASGVVATRVFQIENAADGVVRAERP